jgi:serine/threonine protein kinase
VPCRQLLPWPLCRRRGVSGQQLLPGGGIRADAVSWADGDGGGGGHLGCGATLTYLRYRAAQEEALWCIGEGEVQVCEPLVVLGRGWQGIVVLGLNRGTPVAIKRFLGPGGEAAEVAGSNCSGPSGFDHNESDAPYKPGEFTSGFGGRDKVSRQWQDADSEVWSEKDKTCTAKFAWGDSKLTKGMGLRGRRHLDTALRRDLRLLVGIRHPCVVTVMGVARLRVGGETVTPELCLVMELMALGSLRYLLANRMCPLYGETALGFLRSIAQGMRFLHAASPPMLHGDLASHNVLVDQGFNAKLADIQLASLRGYSPSHSALPLYRPASQSGGSSVFSRIDSVSLSSRGSSGSSGSVWLAPELACGGGPTAAADVYAFGLIIYECLTRSDLALVSGSGSDPSECRTPKAKVSKTFLLPGTRRSSACSPSAVTTTCAAAADLPDPPGASAEVVGLIRECLRSDAGRRPPFHELDRRLAALDVSLMTSAAFAQDGDTNGSPGMSRAQSQCLSHSICRPRCPRPESSMETTLQPDGPRLGPSAARNSDIIMHSLFPPHVVEALLMGRPVPPEPKELVTIFFSDIVGFTTLSSTLDPVQVSARLPALGASRCGFLISTVGEA